LLTAIRKGGTNNETGHGIAWSANNLYVAVDTQNTSTLADALIIAKFTGATVDWTRSAPGAGTGSQEQDSRLSLGLDGEILVTGWFTGTATFGPSTLVSHGAEDMFFARLLTQR
jgi:hypothetical protein